MPATDSATELDPLRQLLADHDTPCPRCGYNLRGLTAPQCPECAQPVTFETLLKQKRTANLPWIITIIAWAAALPWSVFYVWQRLLIRHAFYYGHPKLLGVGAQGGNFTNTFAQASLGNLWCDLSFAYWLSVPLVLLMGILFHRRLMRLPAWLQWSIALAAAMLTLVAFRRWQWWYWHWLTHPAYYQWPDFYWLRQP